MPVVARQTPGLLGTLAAVPARRMVVSGSRVALTKRSSIEDRERGLLERWFSEHDLEPTGDVMALDEELVFVVERKARA